jgi:hypothetical protein
LPQILSRTVDCPERACITTNALYILLLSVKLTLIIVKVLHQWKLMLVHDSSSNPLLGSGFQKRLRGPFRHFLFFVKQGLLRIHVMFTLTCLEPYGHNKYFFPGQSTIQKELASQEMHFMTHYYRKCCVLSF